MTSDERLEEIAFGGDWYPPEVKEAMVELLAHRKAWSEPVYQVEAHGSWADASEDDAAVAEYKGEHVRKLYRKPFSE